MSEINKTEADVVRDMAMAGMVCSGDDFAVLPKDYRVESLEPFKAAPTRKRAMVQFTDVVAFIDYVNAHAVEGQSIVALRELGCTVRASAILDYHAAGDDHGMAGWGDHQAFLNPDFTPEWQKFLAYEKRAMTQKELATFLEDNESIFVNPGGAELRQMIEDLKVSSSAEAVSVQPLSGRRCRLVFTNNVKLEGNGMELPEIIQVEMVPFAGLDKGKESFESVQLSARLLVKQKEGVFGLSYEIIARDRVDEMARDLLIKRIEQCVATVYHGMTVESCGGE